jgi:hypothetical protein
VSSSGLALVVFLRAGLSGKATACDLDTGTNGRIVWRPVVDLVVELVTELRAVELLRAEGDPICSNQRTNELNRQGKSCNVRGPIFGCCDRVRVMMRVAQNFSQFHDYACLQNQSETHFSIVDI